MNSLGMNQSWEKRKGESIPFVMGSATRSLGMHVGNRLTPGLHLLPKLLRSAHGICLCSERSITCFAGSASKKYRIPAFTLSVCVEIVQRRHRKNVDSSVNWMGNTSWLFILCPSIFYSCHAVYIVYIMSIHFFIHVALFNIVAGLMKANHALLFLLLFIAIFVLVLTLLACLPASDLLRFGGVLLKANDAIASCSHCFSLTSIPSLW